MRALAAELGPASVLMNNAGIGQGGDVFAGAEAWTRLLGVNLMGVLNGIQSFAPMMVEGATPGLVINTGSKQGITQPPDNTAYKAGVNKPDFCMSSHCDSLITPYRSLICHYTGDLSCSWLSYHQVVNFAASK